MEQSGSCKVSYREIAGKKATYSYKVPLLAFSPFLLSQESTGMSKKAGGKAPRHKK